MAIGPGRGRGRHLRAGRTLPRRPDPAVREQVAKGLVNKGYTLEQWAGATKRLPLSALDDRFRDDPTPAVREQVAKGLSARR